MGSEYGSLIRSPVRYTLIHIINLEQTLPLFNEAMNFIGKMAAKKGTILFVGTKRAAQKIIQEEALRCGMPYVNRRWLGGLLTNYKTVKQSINRLKDLESMETDGGLDRLSKKEVLHHRRELAKLQSNLSGIKDMKGLPDMLFVIDVGYEDIAVSEAVKLGIPVVGVVDSNNSPNGVDYVIPGNDDAIRAIRLYAKSAADAILEGKSSVAHLGGEGGAGDEFVELDESGAPVMEDKHKKVTRKKTAKKKVTVTAAKKEEGKGKGAKTASAEEAGSKKKTAKKKKTVIKKKTATKKSAAAADTD